MGGITPRLTSGWVIDPPPYRPGSDAYDAIVINNVYRVQTVLGNFPWLLDLIFIGRQRSKISLQPTCLQWPAESVSVRLTAKAPVALNLRLYELTN